MELYDLAEQAKSKEDFIVFLKALLRDYETNKSKWENPNLEMYLEGMWGFLEDSTDKSLHKVDFTPSWKLFAEIMLTASIYE